MSLCTTTAALGTSDTAAPPTHVLSTDPPSSVQKNTGGCKEVELADSETDGENKRSNATMSDRQTSDKLHLTALQHLDMLYKTRQQHRHHHHHHQQQQQQQSRSPEAPFSCANATENSFLEMANLSASTADAATAATDASMQPVTPSHHPPQHLMVFECLRTQQQPDIVDIADSSHAHSCPSNASSAQNRNDFDNSNTPVPTQHLDRQQQQQQQQQFQDSMQQTTLAPSARRRVRFNEQVVIASFLESRLELSDEDFHLRWYNTQDLDRFKTEARALSRELRNGGEVITNTVGSSYTNSRKTCQQRQLKSPPPTLRDAHKPHPCTSASVKQHGDSSTTAEFRPPSEAQNGAQSPTTFSACALAHAKAVERSTPVQSSAPMLTTTNSLDSQAALAVASPPSTDSPTRHALPTIATCTDRSRGLEYRICLDRQKHKVLATKCILKAQQQFQKRPETLAQVARKCTAWATQVAVTVASRDFCEAYHPHLLHLIPGIKTPRVSGFPLPFKKKRKAVAPAPIETEEPAAVPMETDQVKLDPMDVVCERSPVTVAEPPAMHQQPDDKNQDLESAAPSPREDNSECDSDDEADRRVRRRTTTVCH